MNDKTVDIKFHAIKNNSLQIEKDQILVGLFFDAAGVQIYYDLKIVKFMAFNTTLKLISPDIIPSQTKKVMVIKCSNASEIREGLFSADQLSHGLVAVDYLVKLNSEGKFPIMLSNTSNDPIDASNLSFCIEAVFKI